MTAKPEHSQAQAKSRARVVKPGRLPVSEFAFDRAGAASPFGDDVTLPVPTDRLTYQHPDAVTLPMPPHRVTPEEVD
jgi:succinate dehydrogenase / fumarate reductase iron-sulfur subunit